MKNCIIIKLIIVTCVLSSCKSSHLAIFRKTDRHINMHDSTEQVMYSIDGIPTSGRGSNVDSNRGKLNKYINH